jgi:hypothetical protein
MKVRECIVVYVVVVLFCVSSIGYGFSKVGTTAAPFLKIEYGARAVGMAGAFVALADDASGIYYNPAGIAELNRFYVHGGHTRWFADLTYNYATFVLPTRRVNFCLWGSFLSCADIPITTVEHPEGTGQYFDYTDGVLGFTASSFLSDRLSVGVTAKYIQQMLHNESAATFAFDIGSILRTPWKGLRLGMCMVNYGGRMQLSGNDLIVETDPWPGFDGNPDAEARLTTESFPLPLAFKLGIAFDIVGTREAFLESRSNRLTLALDGIHPNDGDEKFHIGFEYSMMDMFFLRGGYKLNYDTQTFTAGTGVKAEIVDKEISINYAYVDMDILDATHRFELCIGF